MLMASPLIQPDLVESSRWAPIPDHCALTGSPLKPVPCPETGCHQELALLHLGDVGKCDSYQPGGHLSIARRQKLVDKYTILRDIL